MFNLNELAIFLAVAEHASFSKAGKQLQLSQSAISQTINNLEKYIDVKLFHRQGRTVTLSEAGQVLRPMAIELIALARKTEETVASLQNEIVGEMNIGCSTSSGKYLLPGLISRFQHKFNHVRINMLVYTRDMVINKLISGELSLGVTSKMVDHHLLDYQEFFTDEVCLIAPARHHWAVNRIIKPEDLLVEPIILREEDSGTYDVVMNGLRRFEITPDMLKVGMVLGNSEAIEMAVAEGLGVSFISRLSALRGLELGRVVKVQVDGLDLHRSIYLLRNNQLPSKRVEAEFWKFARSPEANVIIYNRL